MGKAMFVFVLMLLGLGCLYAGAQESLKSYYQASVDEDIDTYLDSMDLSDKDDEGVQATRMLVLDVWSKYDTEYFEITDYREVEDDEGYVLAKYHLKAGISGQESETVDLDHVALMRKIGGEYKVEFAMPLGMYDELVQQSNTLNIYDQMLERKRVYLAVEPSGQAGVLFDGEPMQDLSSEIEEMDNGCSSDEYCQKHNLGSVCASGSCTYAQQPDDGEDRTRYDHRCTDDGECIQAGYDYCLNGACYYRDEEICMGSVFVFFVPLGLVLALKRKIRLD